MPHVSFPARVFIIAILKEFFDKSHADAPRKQAPHIYILQSREIEPRLAIIPRMLISILLPAPFKC